MTLGATELSVSVGDPVSGSFTIDTSVPNTSTLPDQGYYVQKGLFELQFPQSTLQTTRGFVAVVTNNGPPGFDEDLFHVGSSDLLATGPGVTLPPTVDLISSFDLIDSTATVFSNTDLPTELDLSRFDNQRGIVIGPGDTAVQIQYTIETLTAAVVPEPSGLTLGSVFLGTLAIRAWRRRWRVAVGRGESD